MASVGAKDDELERRAAAELKQTEELLAGFDRSRRTPRAPRTRDFVGYPMDKGRSKPAAPAPGGAADRPRSALPTALAPRHQRKSAAWWAWMATLATIVGFATSIAIAATITRLSEARSSRTSNTGTAAATSAPPSASSAPSASSTARLEAPFDFRAGDR